MKKNFITRLAMILSLFLAAIIWKPIIIFVIPGILILFLPAFKKIELINLIIYIIGLSLCFWISSFWFLKLIPLSLTALFVLVITITVLIAAYCLFRKIGYYKISLRHYNFILIIFFLFLLFLRFEPMSFAITPSGADMSMHTYITQLIVNANGIPDNYHPILGIDEFSSYPVGFHTLSALISFTGNIPSFKSTFVMACLSYVFITLFLFVFLRRFVSWEFAFVSSTSFTFFTRNPQGFALWGGTPTIFALALFILFMSFLDKIKNNNKWLIFFSAISLASVLLSHAIIFIQSFYIFGISFLVYFLLKKEYKEYMWIKYLLVVILFFIIIIPYMIGFNHRLVTPEISDWIKNWVRNSDSVWRGTISNFIWTIPYYIKRFVFGKGAFDYSILISTLGLFLLFNRKLCIQYTIFLILVILSILNTQYWILPFSYAIYPERAATMAIIPLSLFFAYGLKIPFEYLKKNKKLCNKKLISIPVIVLAVFIMISLPSFNKRKYTKGIMYYTSVTEADLKAFNWLEENTDEKDVIQNNYGDGGLWIPSIIFRPISYAHINVIYLDKIKSLGEPKYIYIGRKCVYNCPQKNSDFKDNDKYEQVYSEEGVHIYKILR